MSLPRPRPRLEAVTENASVTPIELFFDLVFVFALTQVSSLMADDLGGQGVLRGILILALLWWSSETVYFAEHRNQIRHEIHGGSDA